MEIIQLKTSDQYDISITLFEPKNSVQKLFWSIRQLELSNKRITILHNILQTTVIP
jgi:hypothetical protein